MFKPRNRIVVFRLSQDEYGRLREACERRGGRNISDFTRSEVLAYLQSDTLGGRVERCFKSMEEKISALEMEIARLNHAIDAAGSEGAERSI